MITLFVGVPPAAVCGLWLACARVWRTQYGLIYAGVVGAGCTVVWLILITGLQLLFDEQGKFELQSLTMLLFFAVLGGLCAVLLGLFFLRQEPEEIEQPERTEQMKRRRKSSSWYLD